MISGLFDLVLKSIEINLLFLYLYVSVKFLQRRLSREFSEFINLLFFVRLWFCDHLQNVFHLLNDVALLKILGIFLELVLGLGFILV